MQAHDINVNLLPLATNLTLRALLIKTENSLV